MEDSEKIQDRVLKGEWLRRVAVVLFGLVLWYIPPPWELTAPAWGLFTVFITAILAVLLNALTIFSAALIAMIIAVLTGILTVEKAFSGFSESFILLILSAFLVAQGIIKSGLGQRIAYLFIRRFGHSTLNLGYCIVATDTLLGPAIPSNTARSGVLYPIVYALSLDTGSEPKGPTRRNTGSYLMMVSIASLTVSSALWLTAMAANPVSASIAGQYGVDMSFGKWLLVSSVPSIMALLVLPYLLYKIFPPVKKLTPGAPELAAEELKKLGPIQTQEWITGLVFVCMIIFWALSGLLQLNLAIVAFAGLAVLLVTGVYKVSDLQREGGEALEIFIWFGILYVMSTALNESGFMSTLGTKISALLTGFHWLQTYILLTSLYVFIHYLFVSQTAHLLALFGVFLEVGSQAQVPVALMAYMLAFATNYFAAITPQGSSANILFAGSGYLEQNEVYRNGLIITVVNLIIYLLATPWILWTASF